MTTYLDEFDRGLPVTFTMAVDPESIMVRIEARMDFQDKTDGKTTTLVGSGPSVDAAIEQLRVAVYQERKLRQKYDEIAKHARG